MTGVALGTICTTVNIVGLMATAALARSRLYLVHRFRMTTCAFQTFVRTGQRKVRLPIVIETPAFPIRRMMAGHAILTHGTVVNIIVLVTAFTGGTNTHILEIAMATFTGNRGVTSQQREMCQIVIEADVFIPTVTVMTLLALHTQ